jgi:predicted DCC family thiol-disulfide oxidoreductase YuxK
MTASTETPPRDDQPVAAPDVAHPVVLFDGVCNLCGSAVNFIMRHDGEQRFRFASLQSTVGQALLREYGLPASTDSVVMIDGTQAYTKSTAVLRIAADLDAPWPLAALAAVLPRQLRDDVYEFVAKHRFQWFGRKAECHVPTEAERARFLA